MLGPDIYYSFRNSQKKARCVFRRTPGSLVGGIPASPDRDLPVRLRRRAGVNTGGSPGRALRRGAARRRTRRRCWRFLGEPGAPSGPGRLQTPAPAPGPRAAKLLGPGLLPFFFSPRAEPSFNTKVMNGPQREAAEGQPTQPTHAPAAAACCCPEPGREPRLDWQRPRKEGWEDRRQKEG